MSQGYAWSSFEKNEALEVGWCGNKLRESAWTGCKQNNAVLTLLADRWAGDHLVWYGCEGFDFRNCDTPFKQQLLYEYGVDYFYDAKDISGIFPDSRNEWSHYAPIGPNREWLPVYYDGPFDTEIKWYRYVVNLEKRQYIDRERTAVRCVVPGEVWRDDLFPQLCVPLDREPGEGYWGMWFGDLLAATNELPGEGYEDLSYLKTETSVMTGLSNEEILEYVSEGAPEVVEPPGTFYTETAWFKYANERLNELIGTDWSGEVVDR
mgnify:CR=1 FL=1